VSILGLGPHHPPVLIGNGDTVPKDKAARSLGWPLTFVQYRHEEWVELFLFFPICFYDVNWDNLAFTLYYLQFFSSGAAAPSGPGHPHYRGFTITLRHSTLDRTPLDEWSVRRRDLYITTHNTHKRQTSMPPAGFEPTVPAIERPQTHSLGRAAIGIGIIYNYSSCFQHLLSFIYCSWNGVVK
jgi:hypothetical protein